MITLLMHPSKRLYAVEHDGPLTADDLKEMASESTGEHPSDDDYQLLDATEDANTDANVGDVGDGQDPRTNTTLSPSSTSNPSTQLVHVLGGPTSTVAVDASRPSSFNQPEMAGVSPKASPSTSQMIGLTADQVNKVGAKSFAADNASTASGQDPTLGNANSTARRGMLADRWAPDSRTGSVDTSKLPVDVQALIAQGEEANSPQSGGVAHASASAAGPVAGNKGQLLDASIGYWKKQNGMDLTPYRGAMSSALQQFPNLDPRLLTAVIYAESDGHINSHSHVGASGLMQIMPPTWRENQQKLAKLGIKVGDDPYNVNDNIVEGAYYLSGLLKQYNGNVDLALAAYNAGPGAVKKYGGVPPFDETVNYVHKIKDAYSDMQRLAPGVSSNAGAVSSGGAPRPTSGTVASSPQSLVSPSHGAVNSPAPSNTIDYHLHPIMYGYVRQPVPGHEDKIFDSVGNQVDPVDYDRYRAEMNDYTSQLNAYKNNPLSGTWFGGQPPQHPKPARTIPPTSTPLLPAGNPGSFASLAKAQSTGAPGISSVSLSGPPPTGKGAQARLAKEEYWTDLIAQEHQKEHKASWILDDNDPYSAMFASDPTAKNSKHLDPDGNVLPGYPKLIHWATDCGVFQSKIFHDEDPFFPANGTVGTSKMMEYFSSPASRNRWIVGSMKSTNPKALLPGDLLVKYGHTAMYGGLDPKRGYIIYQGSIDSNRIKEPAVGHEPTKTYVKHFPKFALWARPKSG